MNEIERIEYGTMLEGIVELTVPNAKAVRAYYNALVGEGFDKTQALMLTINHGYMPPFPSSNEGE